MPSNPVLVMLVASVVIVSAAGWASKGLRSAFVLWPYGVKRRKQFHRLLTAGWVHADPGHLFFNMLGVWMFGSELEHVWGPRRFLQFYTASVIAAALTQLVVNALLGSQAPTIGASGGLFGLLLAFAVLFPNRIILLFFVLPMKAKWLAVLYGALELYQGIYVMNSGIAHFAHLGGMLGGLLMLRYWRGQAPFGRR